MATITAPAWARQTDPTPDTGDPFLEGPTIANKHITAALAWDGSNAKICITHARLEPQLRAIYEAVGGMSIHDALFISEAIRELANIAQTTHK